MSDNEEELHQIELEDGNVPQIANQDNQDNQDYQDNDDQPTPEDVYNRIVTFESTLEKAWISFKDDMMSMISSIQSDIDSLRSEVLELKNSDLRSGSSVVIFPERLVGIVTRITRLNVIVKLDNDGALIMKKKEEVRAIY